MTRALYITYTGLLDPLGQSQVLQYVLGLSQRHHMVVLSYEKPENLTDTARLAELEDRLKAAGVTWHRRIWHRKPGIPATIYDINRGIAQATRIVREEDIQLVHCRSYIGSMIGLAVKKRTGAKLIFDMRGFWPDERVEGGIWRAGSLPYRYFKRIERKLFQQADHVVSLTRAGVREIAAMPYLTGRMPPVSVIPTCTNLDMFHPVPTARRGFTLGYVGSVGSWYMFTEVAQAVARLFEMRPDARFLVINKGGHDLIRSELEKAGVDLSRVEIRQVPFDQVAEQIGRMDAGIFFIKPVWSKRASCPTRMGEFLACGKPCLANAGCGDVEEDFAQTQTGVTLPSTDDQGVDLSGLDAALEQLIALSTDPKMQTRCRSAAEERFSLGGAIEEYDSIYQRLAE
ncbi:glycosyltransferase [Thalassovita sp.]|jgi:glycosyltransferase involved in cell wall biosynthesis|uniref:glycosyltransferase n=1 Tax=Thalassovita sp. TaxID=1979401 RepID=UPI003B5967F1